MLRAYVDSVRKVLVVPVHAHKVRGIFSAAILSTASGNFFYRAEVPKTHSL